MKRLFLRLFPEGQACGEWKDATLEVNGENGIGWLTLALINAGLAQGKNRSGLNWFFISLLIGPLATLLIVVWDRIPKEPERKKMY